jgi:hypothetical protein
LALTTAERERVRYHLGYLQVEPAASISFGIPRPIQTLFLVETALTNLLEVAEPRLRKIIQVMDDIECKLIDSVDVLEASQMGDLHTRENAPGLIDKEYYRWASRLADMLGVPLYPYSARFKQFIGGGNVPVRR